MATQPPTERTGHRPLLIGIGAGCGCLAILGAVLVVILILAAIPKASQGPGPAPNPAPVPSPQPTPPPGPVPQPGPSPAPQPAPAPSPAPPAPPLGPGPQPSPGPSGTLKIQVVTVKVDQNSNPTQESDEFRVGETVGAFVQWASIPTEIPMNYVWLKVDGDKVQPVTEPKAFTVKPEFTGKHSIFTLGTEGGAPGEYAFYLFVRGSGDQIQGVGAHKFTLR